MIKAALNRLAYYYEMKVQCCEMQCGSRLLKDMRDESLLIEPDMITYSTIMKEYFSSGDLDKGVLLLQQMEEGGSFSRIR